jgi:hypothetical protein
VIRSAELRAASKHGSGPGNVDTVSPPSANEQQKLHDAAKSGGPVNVGGKGITPGASGAPFKTAGFGTDLPTLVLIVLLALAAAMAGSAFLAVRRHRPALARVGGPLAEQMRRLRSWAKDGITRFRR